VAARFKLGTAPSVQTPRGKQAIASTPGNNVANEHAAFWAFGSRTRERELALVANTTKFAKMIM
jgi:hypothetical protein